MLRYSTARKIPLRSPQNERRVARVSAPGFSVATRKIAARESGATIGWATARATLGALLGSESIVHPPGNLQLIDNVTFLAPVRAGAAHTRAGFGAEEIAHEVEPAGHVEAFCAVAVMLVDLTPRTAQLGLQ